MIKCAYKNILETAAVSLSAGAEDPSYPVYRLYDRDIGRLFRPAAAVTLEVRADQGAAGSLAADRLLIPAGHNLDGMTLDVLYSDNDADYYAAVAQWAQGGNGLINKSWASATHRYWKLKITAPAVIPQFAEIFLTQTYEWERNPARPAGPFDPEFNVEHSQTAAGHDRFLKHGEPRRRRAYQMPVCGQAQKDNVSAFFDGWAGSKPFWLEDHGGAWIFGRLRGPLNLREVAYQAYSFDFDFIEVLP